MKVLMSMEAEEAECTNGTFVLYSGIKPRIEFPRCVKVLVCRLSATNVQEGTPLNKKIYARKRYSKRLRTLGNRG